MMFQFRPNPTCISRHQQVLMRLVIVFFCSISLFFSLSHAQSFHLTTPRVAAMGSAGIGGAQANSALVLNPAGMSAGAFYAVDANYFRTSEKANLLGINVVDSQTRYTRDRFALGLGYQGRIQDGEATAHDAQIGFSRPASKIGNMLLLLGGSARYIYDEISQRDNFDINIGAMLQLSSLVSLGIVGAELLDDSHRKVGSGIAVTTKQIAINLDYLRYLETKQDQYRAGAEFMVSDSLVFRGGYLYGKQANSNSMSNNLNSTIKQWSIGLAFVGLGGGDGQLSLSYSEQVDTEHSFFGLSLATYLRMGEN